MSGHQGGGVVMGHGVMLSGGIARLSQGGVVRLSQRGVVMGHVIRGVLSGYHRWGVVMSHGVMLSGGIARLSQGGVVSVMLSQGGVLSGYYRGVLSWVMLSEGCCQVILGGVMVSCYHR